MKKLVILIILFITVSSYKETTPSRTEDTLEEIRHNLYMANKDLQEVSIIISDEKNLKKIQRKIRNENN